MYWKLCRRKAECLHIMFNEIIMPTSHIQRSPAEIVDRPNVAEFQIRQGFRAFFF